MEGRPAVVMAPKKPLQSDHQIPSWTGKIRGGRGSRGKGMGSEFACFVLSDVENGEPVVHVQLNEKRI